LFLPLIVFFAMKENSKELNFEFREILQDCFRFNYLGVPYYTEPGVLTEGASEAECLAMNEYWIPDTDHVAEICEGDRDKGRRLINRLVRMAMHGPLVAPYLNLVNPAGRP
jgi:hypothetical protein